MLLFTALLQLITMAAGVFPPNADLNSKSCSSIELQILQCYGSLNSLSKWPATSSSVLPAFFGRTLRLSSLFCFLVSGRSLLWTIKFYSRWFSSSFFSTTTILSKELFAVQFILAKSALVNVVTILSNSALLEVLCFLYRQLIGSPSILMLPDWVGTRLEFHLNSSTTQELTLFAGACYFMKDSAVWPIYQRRNLCKAKVGRCLIGLS